MKRRLVFRVVLLLFLGLLVEGGAFVVLWTLDGEAFSYRRIRQEQLAVAGEIAPEEVEALRVEPPDTRFVHPYLGYLPGSRATQRDDLFKIHGQEFYEPDAPLYHPHPNQILIGISGGSVAAGFCVHGARVLREELPKIPKFAGKEIVIVWLAARGNKQPQALMALNYLLALGGRLDYLINLDGYNEVALHAAENAHEDVFPIFPRGWMALVRRGADVRSDRIIGEIVYLKSQRSDLARKAAKSPLRFSLTRNMVWKLRDRALLAQNAEAEKRLQDLEGEERSFLLNGPTFDHGDRTFLYETLAGIWKRSSIQLNHLCRANNIEYYHFLQPSQYLEGAKPLSAQERRTAFDPRHPYTLGAKDGYPRLLEKGEELLAEGVRFYDLTRVFADVSETLYVDPICHFNPKGHQLIAQKVIEAMTGE